MQDTDSLKIIKPKERMLNRGLVETFTGEVNFTMLFEGENPSTMSAGYVCFECCARSAWHTHPKGQLLAVTGGSGLIQEWGKQIRRIQKGDVIWTPPGVKHWHGASPETTMTHLAIQESLNGKSVEWMEKVTDIEYNKPAQ
jgi:quercetin dioxygenase-like cupin family protein